MWRLNNMLLTYQWITEEIKEEITETITGRWSAGGVAAVLFGSRGVKAWGG